MAKYRKRPVVVEAYQWRKEDGVMMSPPQEIDVDCDEHGYCYVTTIHGDRAFLTDGDWVIKEPGGMHFYPCKPDIFEQTYEFVSEEVVDDDEEFEVIRSEIDAITNEILENDKPLPEIED